MNVKKIIFVLTMCVVASGCGTNNPTGGTFQFTASGEVLALNGYAFPPTAGQTAFVDGWEVQFSKLLVTIDHITLSENPDLSPTDQSQTGKKVAQLNGPWAIDLHQGGPLPGKGGGDEEAYPIATLNKQNLNGNAPFDETVRYAFSFDVVPATASATFLQMDANDTDYADMVQNGWTVLYIGTATWNGGSSCTSTNPSFDFTQLPPTVSFRFGFASPTTYINCQNPDNDPAKGLGNEEHERGIQVKANQTVVAQVTIHTDHTFWESFVHDSPAHFDQLAALASGTQGNYNVTLDSTLGVDYEAFMFGANPLPWRSCLSTYTPPNNNLQMGFDSLDVPYDPSGDPAHYMRDYHDYMTYDQSTQGHLNADGLCFVSRNYPSPP
jgi:hypothetical protein